MATRFDTFSTAEGTEHENTTTEGSIARRLFAAGDLAVGKGYRFVCGIIVNDNNSTDTLTPRVRFGSSSTVTSNTELWGGAAVNVEDNDVGLVEGEIYVESATRITYWVRGTNGVDATGTLATTTDVGVFTSAADTAYYLDITLDWSVAHADNEAAAAFWKVQELT